MKKYLFESFINGNRFEEFAREADELEVLQKYFQVKENVKFNYYVRYRINTVNCSADGTIKEFIYTTIYDNGETINRWRYTYRLIED